MPARVIVTAGPVAGCTQAGGLVEGIEAENPIADRGYDSDAIVEMAGAAGMEPVIPPRCNRKEQRQYDECLYRLRRLADTELRQIRRNSVSCQGRGGTYPGNCWCRRTL
jgi:transposase